MHKYLANLWKKPMESLGEIQKSRLTEWRKQGTVVRIDRPTRIDRARNLGYKAKQGFVVARVRVKKGKRKRQKPSGGRVPKKAGRFFTLNMSKQVVAEQKAARKFPNLRVLSSYYVGEDGANKWFECILIDPNHPTIKKSRETNWICSGKQKGRAFRGLTSAGKKSRGLLRKGKGAEKVR